MEIARLWGKEPDWYWTLDLEGKAQMLAWYSTMKSGEL